MPPFVTYEPPAPPPPKYGPVIAEIFPAPPFPVVELCPTAAAPPPPPPR